jgi:hypothetical protein
MEKMPQRTYERIKNFSTTIPVEKTISEIEKILAIHGASGILKQYDHRGRPISLAFKIRTQDGDITIMLPARVERVKDVFKLQAHDKKLPKKYWEGIWQEEQALRTGWRTIKDWLDAQLSLIEIDMVKIEEIFLPYMAVTPTKTLYQAFEEKHFDFTKMLPGGQSNE